MPLTTSTAMRRAYVPGPDGIILGKELAVCQIDFFFPLASLAANGNILTGWVPGFKGRFLSAKFAIHKAATTASKRADINLEINGVDVTGGVISITSAEATPAGKIISGTAITANNAFDVDDVVDIELSNVTAHVEGDGTLILMCQIL